VTLKDFDWAGGRLAWRVGEGLKVGWEVGWQLVTGITCQHAARDIGTTTSHAGGFRARRLLAAPDAAAAAADSNWSGYDCRHCCDRGMRG